MHSKKWIQRGIAAISLLAALITIWKFSLEREPTIPPGASSLIDRGAGNAGKIELVPTFGRGSIREGAGLIELRAISGARELRGTEESAPISELPNGVFGYIGDRGPSLFLDRFDNWPVYKKKGQVFNIEVHKTREGEVLLFGYVSEGDLRRLLTSAGDRDVETFILSEPKLEYKFLVGIPVLRVKEWDSRNGEELGAFAWIKVR